MKSLRAGLLCLALTWIGTAAAQQPPQVWIPPEPGNQPITLDEVSIEVRMHGFLARTRIQMRFHNPNARVMEGEFVFPLGAGQTVTGYALDVNGTMREGVVVPKETARVAFEETSRQRIDPGLVELTRGNVFRTRLYPIPANGDKRIALEFEQVMDDAGSHWRYVLPLQFRDAVKKFSVKAEAPLDAAAPQVASDSPDAALQFEQTATVWRAELARENVTPQRELSFRVPRQASDSAVLEAPSVLEPAERAVLARIDTGYPDTLAARPAPRRVAIFFDASGSARDRDLARERAALAAWFKTLDAAEVSLIAFRDAAETARRFSVRNGKAAELLAVLETLPLDGASNYGAIDFAAVKGTDLALVVGDGLDTFGRGHTDFANAPARLFVLHAAQRADPVRLADIAQRGGRVLDLTRIDANQAAAMLNAPGWRLLETRVVGQCMDIAPRAPQPVERVLTVTARCTGKSTMSLVFGDANGARSERSLTIGEREPVTGTLGDSVWRAVAATRIARLAANAKPDVDAITRLAVRHGVVTAHTSLLVLDRIEDYVRYDVAPKEADLRAAYEKLRLSQPKPNEAATRDARLSDLARRWREFSDWHGQRHPWLETLLVPTAEAEAALWQRLAASTDLSEKVLADSRQDIDAIARQSRALADRWSKDGTQAGSRRAWERDATALMLRLDALRQRRLERVPGSGHSRDAASDAAGGEFGTLNAEVQAPMPMPAPPPSPAPAEAVRQHSAQAEAGASLDRIEVSGSRIANDIATGEPAPSALRARVELSGWNPDTPYLKALRQASNAYAAYLELRREHGNAPAFFLDSADFFRNEARQPALALRVLSNLAEIGDENTALLRVLGYRLSQWDRPDLAVRPFEDALAQRPEEPQSHRDLALALAHQQTPDNARATALLWHVATTPWSNRFPDVDLIALHELTALLAVHPDTDISALAIPPELLAPVTTGLRVVLGWDADNTDIDLWVIDPAGEPVYYSRPRSASGGHISRDFTGGYGPEVFTIARPLPGTYRVQTHYFGDRRQSLTGPVTVQVEFQTGFGSREPTRVATTRRLESTRERMEVGQFQVRP
jgi:hypothetical protein